MIQRWCLVVLIAAAAAGNPGGEAAREGLLDRLRSSTLASDAEKHSAEIRGNGDILQGATKAEALPLILDALRNDPTFGPRTPGRRNAVALLLSFREDGLAGSISDRDQVDMLMHLLEAEPLAFDEERGMQDSILHRMILRKARQFDPRGRQMIVERAPGLLDGGDRLVIQEVCRILEDVAQPLEGIENHLLPLVIRPERHRPDLWHGVEPDFSPGPRGLHIGSGWFLIRVPAAAALFASTADLGASLAVIEASDDAAGRVAGAAGLLRSMWNERNPHTGFYRADNDAQTAALAFIEAEARGPFGEALARDFLIVNMPTAAFNQSRFPLSLEVRRRLAALVRLGGEMIPDPNLKSLIEQRLEKWRPLLNPEESP